MKTSRWLICSLLAAATTCVLPVLGLIWGLSHGTGTLPDGSPDDAPYRASVVLLALMPVGFLLLFLYFLGITRALHRFGRLSLRWVVLVNLPPCLLVASAFARQEYFAFGIRDAAIAFALFGTLLLVCLTLGSIVWCVAWRWLGGQSVGASSHAAA